MNEILWRQLKLIAALISLSLPYLVNAQQEIPGNSVDWNMINSATGQYTLSPQAAAMEKFGTYPVNKASGIPDISIPIYTIKSGSLEYPLVLSYHMGGIRVEEIPSWVGLGWSLNANGVINRTIQGIADERTDNIGWLRGNRDEWPYHVDDYWTNINAMGGENLVYQFYQSIDNRCDKGSDTYRYSVNGLTGGFVYDFDRQLVQTPLTDNKIERDGENNFTITDAKGVQYKFLAKHTEESWNRDEYGSRSSPVTWQVSQIISADRADTLVFSYAQPVTYEEIHRSFSLTRGRPYRASSNYRYFTPSLINQTSLNHSESVTIKTERLLGSIKFRGGEVVFYTGLREDMGRERIHEIEVKNIYGSTVKRVRFQYGYFNTAYSQGKKEDKRLKLTKILVYGNNNGTPREYSFSYNETSKLPSYDQRRSNGVGIDYNGQDYWGYYNGVSTNKSLLLTEYAGSFKADREPRENSMKAGVLTRIDFPTGGYTVFETEANRAKKNGVERIVGGLRIARITSYTGGADPSPHITSYAYEDGALIYFPDPVQYEVSAAFSYLSWPGNSEAGGDIFAYDTKEPYAPATTYMEAPMSPMGRYQGSPVMYKKISETQGYYRNTNSSNEIITEGKTVYKYGPPRLQIGYLYTYTPSSLFGSSAIPIDWQNGQLEKMEIYKKAGQNWELLKEVEHEYTTFQQEFFSGTLTSSRVIFQWLSHMPFGPILRASDAECFFNHLWTRSLTGWHHLTKTIEREYSSHETRQISTVFEYGNMDAPENRRNMLVSAIRRYTRGEDLIDRKEYVYAHQGDPAMAQTMRFYNMLAYPYEERVYDNKNNLISKSHVNYSAVPGAGSGVIKPARVWKTYSAAGPEVLEMEYLRYDKRGNPVEIRDKSGMTTVYLWAYYGLYPIAEILNATYSQVAGILGEALIERNLMRGSPGDYLEAVEALRTNPAMNNAHITTYDFKPLCGVVKSTDPSGRSTYYEYDSFGSLSKIRDDQRSPVQEFQYNYVN